MLEQDGSLVTAAELTPWIVFLAAVAVLLVVDIGVLGRRGATMTTRCALAWSAVWISLGLSFSLAAWAWRGSVAAQEYLAGYLIEESLSIDNLFVFLLVFGSLGIAPQYRRKILFWGDEEARAAKDPTRAASLIVLSVATSIDALAVGLSLDLLGVEIWTGAVCLCRLREP